MIVVAILWSLFVVITVHELGHFMVAYVLRRPISSMTVGFGPLIYEKLWDGMWFRFRLVPLSGNVTMCWRSRRSWKNISILAGGPFANFILAGTMWGTTLGTVSMLVGFLNLVPRRFGDIDSDGLLIMRELRRMT